MRTTRRGGRGIGRTRPANAVFEWSVFPQIAVPLQPASRGIRRRPGARRHCVTILPLQRNRGRGSATAMIAARGQGAVGAGRPSGSPQARPTVDERGRAGGAASPPARRSASVSVLSAPSVPTETGGHRTAHTGGEAWGNGGVGAVEHGAKILLL